MKSGINNGLRLIACSILVLIFVSPLLAEPRLAAIFSDHMVLQQGQRIPVWGWAEPEENINVTLGMQRRVTQADYSGRWMVEFSPLTPGRPLRMTVQGEQTVILNDILVGEVWVCSGQSNMNFAMNGMTEAAKEIKGARLDEIRLFTVPKEKALEPITKMKSAWEVCSPETVGSFSAVGYLFGRGLHKKLKTPVGLIHSSWPGTNAEEWTEPSFLESDSVLTPILERWAAADSRDKELYVSPPEFELWFDDFELLGSDGNEDRLLDDFSASDLTNRMGGAWTAESSPQDEFPLELVEDTGEPGSSIRVAGTFGISDQSLLRSSFAPQWKPVDLTSYKGLRFRVRGVGNFKLHILQPTITDWDNYVTKVISVGGDWKPVTVLFSEVKQAGWGKQLPFTQDQLAGFMIEQLISETAPARPPGGLFNGMIAPIVSFPIRGAIWYQGEGNAGRAFQYRSLLPSMISSWRDAWGQGDFPFLVVQLPNFKRRQSEPSESAWAELREAQLKTLAVPEVGLAVSIDAGEADDVHPKDKRKIGERLALWALGTTYEKKLTYSGPLFREMVKEGDRLRLRFDHRGKGLVSDGGGPLRGFAVAGEDREFHWAEAKIEKGSVVVWSSEVPEPLAVRYAWADNPDCNLYNKAGLPASPFRTDDWPGVTFEQR